MSHKTPRHKCLLRTTADRGTPQTVVDADQREMCEGEVLRIVWRQGVWFGFIKRGIELENVYFDSRGFGGETTELTPDRRSDSKLPKVRGTIRAKRSRRCEYCSSGKRGRLKRPHVRRSSRIATCDV